jgi:hypothetical protein
MIHVTEKHLCQLTDTVIAPVAAMKPAYVGSAKGHRYAQQQVTHGKMARLQESMPQMLAS